MQKDSCRLTTEDRVVNIVNYFLLTIVALVALYPFYYTVVCSFSDGYDLMRAASICGRVSFPWTATSFF